MSLADGDVVDGRYRIEGPLGEGGMGIVYRAQHLGLQKAVALKLLRAEVADVPGIAARFEREARATSQLDHPHIVRVLDFGRAPQGLYLVMELLDGRPLTEALDEVGVLPPERALRIAGQLLDGLGAAHARGLVHRDLKPDNVFLCGAGEHVKILDFGIAAVRGDAAATKLTQAGAVLGTPSYMAPEQAMGRADLDARTDLHAVGVLLYEMLSGRLPYEGDNYNQVISAILRGHPTPLEQLRPGLPPAIYAAVQGAMAPRPVDRPANAGALRALLEGKGEPTPAFAMPKVLSVTELGDKPARALAPTHPGTNEAPAAPRAPIAADEPPALELDRPSPAAPSVESPAPRPSVLARYRRHLLAIAVASLVGGAVLLWRSTRTPPDVTIELGEVPVGARLRLDGQPIVGHRLVLPRSSAEHVITIDTGKHGVRTVRFRADEDRTIDVGR